jgi:hypothetical protein
VNPFEVYSKYCALKRHFTDWNYDYIKYNGKLRLKPESFERRRDKYYFEKLERHRDPIGVLIFNLAENPDAWIKDIASVTGEDIYCKHRGVIESMTHSLKQDLNKLDPDFDKNFKCDEGMPVLLKKCVGGHVSMETATLLLEMTGAGQHWKENYNDHLFADTVIRLIRLKSFVEYDREKARVIVLEHFQKKVGEIA